MKIHSVLLCTTGALAVISAAGCGGSSSSGMSAPTLIPRSVSAILTNGLTGTLTEDRTTVAKGGTVTYTLTLSNATAQPITYQPVISGQGNFTVKDPSGNIAYPTGAFPQLVLVGPSTTLAPGQSAAYDTETVGSGTGSFSLSGQYDATANFDVKQGATATSPGADGFGAAGPLPVAVQ